MVKEKSTAAAADTPRTHRGPKSLVLLGRKVLRPQQQRPFDVDVPRGQGLVHVLDGGTPAQGNAMAGDRTLCGWRHHFSWVLVWEGSLPDSGTVRNNLEDGV